MTDGRMRRCRGPLPDRHPRGASWRILLGSVAIAVLVACGNPAAPTDVSEPAPPARTPSYAPPTPAPRTELALASHRGARPCRPYVLLWRRRAASHVPGVAAAGPLGGSAAQPVARD